MRMARASEVHCNTLEGIWTGLRNFLRSFRGVHKKYLAQYVAIFEWAHNLKEVTLAYLRRRMGCFTPEPTRAVMFTLQPA
jgi:transposase-like protein